ncbi:MAG: hypothetical protein IPF65_01345 [Polaromonas sp.]|nr:hypothetical protein [Polaromonas sp.]
MTNKSIEALVDDFRTLHRTFRNRARVRALSKDLKPATKVKYGGILFASGVQFGGVFAYKDHVLIEFGSGAKIKDPWLPRRQWQIPRHESSMRMTSNQK